MSGFLSAEAMTSKNNNRRPYTLTEDQLICTGLEDGDSASVIVEALAAKGYTRTVLSIRYRITALRDAASKYSTLEDFHAKRNAISAEETSEETFEETSEVVEEEVDVDELIASV